MRNLKQMRQILIESLRQKSPTPVLDVDLLLCHGLGLSPVDLILRDTREILEEEKKILEALVERRGNAEPIAYILGHKAFMGLTFLVNQSVLIPRPDTEIVVEAVLGMIPRDAEIELLDIGTGSGAILLSLLHERSNAKGTGLDISRAALLVAEQNAVRLGLSQRAEWLESDLFSQLGQRKFDFIISNPPYINARDMADLDSNVIDFEPYGALYGGVDGLDFYRVITSKAIDFLLPGGGIAFEIGYDQKEAVTLLLEQADFEWITCYNDFAGHHRAIVARLKG